MITLTPQQRLILIAALGKYGIADALETLGVENTPETRRRVKDQRNEIIEACDADRIVISTPSAKLRSLLVPLPDDNALIEQALDDALAWQYDKLDRDHRMNDYDDEDRVHIQDTIRAYERLQHRLFGQKEKATK